MTIIVNVSRDWGIGIGGDMLVSISADLRRFKSLTTGGTVIMGSSTLRSLPGGKPLNNRRNIVLTSKPELLPEGAEACASLDELLELIKDEPEKSVFVIGGDSVYRQLLPYCDKAFITKTDVSMTADRFFPNLDQDPSWRVLHEGEVMEEKGMNFRYVDYIRRRF